MASTCPLARVLRTLRVPKRRPLCRTAALLREVRAPVVRAPRPGLVPSRTGATRLWVAPITPALGADGPRPAGRGRHSAPRGGLRPQNGPAGRAEARGKKSSPTASNARGASRGCRGGRRGRRRPDPPTGSPGRCSASSRREGPASHPKQGRPGRLRGQLDNLHTNLSTTQIHSQSCRRDSRRWGASGPPPRDDRRARTKRHGYRNTNRSDPGSDRYNLYR